jgi:uncharacterized protein (TIGR02266 family)
VALTLKKTSSGPGPVLMSEQELNEAEVASSEREATLLKDARELDQLATTVKVRLDRLKARAAGQPQAPSIHAELATVGVVEIKRPGAWTSAIEARNSTLRARWAAQDALERDTATRARELNEATTQIAELDALLDQAERRRAEEQAQQEASAKTVIRGEMDRALAALRTTGPEPIPLTQKSAPTPAPVMAPPPVASAKGAAAPSPSERRVHRRVRLEADVSLESESNFFAGFGEDISAGGLFVATHSYAPMGTTIDVSFKLGDTQIAAAGTVRWVRELDDKNPDMIPGMGIQFTTLPEGAQAAIERFVRSREPMFWVD